MFLHRRCDNCHRMLNNGDKVTVIIPDVEIEGRYRKNKEGFRLKLSNDGVEIRTSKVYCKKCLSVDRHFLTGEEK